MVVYTDENEFLLSSRPASSFAAEGDEGFSLQDNERGEGSGAENRRICKSGRTKHGSLLCRGYDELQGRPQDRYWPFVTIKKFYKTFFFDTVIHLYLYVLSLFALRTAGHRENDNVEGFYGPIVYLQKKIEHHPFRVGNR